MAYTRTVKPEDRQKGDAVKTAQSILSQQPASGYRSPYQSQLEAAVGRIQDRDPFTYDINADAMYQQMVDQYVNQGRQAMMDTMGQAATLTGGYGNTYAQTAGQQTYQNYLQQATEMVPDYYQMALQRYVADGEDLYNQYGLLADLDDQAYGRYRDQIADEQWQKEFDENKRRYDQEWKASQKKSSGGSSSSRRPYTPKLKDEEEVEETEQVEEEITFGNVGETARQMAASGQDPSDYLAAARQAGYISVNQYRSLMKTFGY